MRVLVTGGAGFIGSHLAIALVRHGHRVRVLDNFYSGQRDNLRVVAADVEVVEGDCADAETARRAVKDMDAVLHEAAIPSVVRSVADPALSHRANATATLSMLLAARDARVRRFVYAGLVLRLRRPARAAQARGHGRRGRCRPTPWASSPASTTRASSRRLYGMETVTLRYFNVFGPHQDATSPYSGVMGLFITALLEGRAPVVYGDGKQSRDFTYVDNVVDANLRALEVRAGCAGRR